MILLSETINMPLQALRACPCLFYFLSTYSLLSMMLLFMTHIIIIIIIIRSHCSTS